MKNFLQYLKIDKSTIDGRGLFALLPIPARKKIGELQGKLIRVSAARKKASQKQRIAIVEVDYEYAIDASDGENPFKYINHSCQPNSYMRIINRRVEFYSLRKIKKGEELTCDYGESHHEGTKKCNCGAVGCIGSL